MGFGPSLPSDKQAVQAVLDIVALLYPERATTEALSVLKSVSSVLLAARAPMSFESIDRFLANPDWRQHILERAPEHESDWAQYAGRSIPPTDLDADFAWLLGDRLRALDRGED